MKSSIDDLHWGCKVESWRIFFLQSQGKDERKISHRRVTRGISKGNSSGRGIKLQKIFRVEMPWSNRRWSPFDLLSWVSWSKFKKDSSTELWDCWKRSWQIWILWGFAEPESGTEVWFRVRTQGGVDTKSEDETTWHPLILGIDARWQRRLTSCLDWTPWSACFRSQWFDLSKTKFEVQAKCRRQGATNASSWVLT